MSEPWVSVTASLYARGIPENRKGLREIGFSVNHKEALPLEGAAILFLIHLFRFAGETMPVNQNTAEAVVKQLEGIASWCEICAEGFRNAQAR